MSYQVSTSSRKKFRTTIVAVAIFALIVIAIGLRLGFERRTERLPISVMPDVYRALPVPRGLAPIDEGCEMMHRGLTRRYLCTFKTFDPPKKVADRLSAQMIEAGWRAQGPDEYTRQDWHVGVRYSEMTPGTTHFTIVLERNG